MSKSYEDLTEREKLVGSIHFPGRTGPRLERLLKALQHQLDVLVLNAADLVKDSFQVTTAVSGDLTDIGSFLDLVRLAEEPDDDYRNRVVVAASTFETVTKDAILQLFEDLVGKQPYFTEPFHTKLYSPGETYEPPAVGEFTLIFEIPMAIKSENLIVASGGTSVIASDSNIGVPYSDSMSTNVNTTTDVIPVNSTTEFPDWGEIIIEDEWISYTTKATDSFGGCTRGLYTSVPATHATNAAVIEGSTKVFLEGTNNVVYNSQSGTTIFIDGGPYDWDTYFDVSYRIATTGLKLEYDTPDELGRALSQLQAIGFDYKAAGIKANIFMGLVLRSWFQESREVLTLFDTWEIMVDFGGAGFGLLDVFSWPANPDRSVFFESAWEDDNYEWDGTVWTQAFWNGSAWERIDGPKGWYNVEISLHT